MFSLHYREPEPEPVQQVVIAIKEKEQIGHPKVAQTWTSWLSAYFIYATVLLKAQPARCTEIMKYRNITCRAYNSFQGSAWLQYNEAFHVKAAMHPEILWDKLDIELWMEIMTFNMPIKGTRMDSGLVLTGHAGQRKARTKKQKLC